MLVAPSGSLTHDVTLAWLARAADEPAARHVRGLPPSLDFGPHAGLFSNVLRSAPAGTELGFPVLLSGGRLVFPPAVAARAHHSAFQDEGRFVGTFHVHPEGSPSFFDPADLAAALRSDNPGFVELLLTPERLLVLVRSNPYLYISAHHVNRNPLLLTEEHEVRWKRARDRSTEEDPYRQAGLYWFHRYQLALYEGDPSGELRRAFTPEGSW